jgi:PAS domain S-box-containing protein
MEASSGIDRTQDLETSLSFLRAALESTADGLLVVDRQGHFTLFNARFSQMWRIPLEVLSERDDAVAIAWVTRQVLDPHAFLAKIRELYSTPESTSFDVIHLSEHRTFERYSQPQWLGGQVVGRVWSFRDVTARVRSEEELHRRTAELAAVLENMLEPVVACDTERRLFCANKAARTVVDVKPNETLDELQEHVEIRDTSGRLLSTDELPIVRALEGELIQNLDLLIQPKGGSLRSMRTSSAPIRDEAGRVVAAVSVSRDVTERVELENLKDQFVRVAAHELKTPVAVMKSCAELALRQSEGLTPQLARMLAGVNRGADRIDKIVRSLLDLSQLLLGAVPAGLEAEHLRERVELGALLETAVARQTARARHRIQRTVPDGLTVVGNRERLLQVFDALLDNAIRYSPGGGEIQVTARAATKDVRIEIEDHGVGIADEKQAQIFERFYRPLSGSPHDYGGMGIGLFLSHEIVRRHGGHLWFRSIDGVGSHFFVSLPKAGAEP